MFQCMQCPKAFTRKDSLLRHIKTLHTRPDVGGFSSDNNTRVINQFENTTDHYPLNSLSNQTSNSVEYKPPSVRDDLSEPNYEADDNDDDDDGGRNDADDGISHVVQNTNGNIIAEVEEGSLNPFDQRILAATEAIKSKFNALRKSRNDFQNYDNKSPPPKNHEDSTTGIITKSNNATASEDKLAELLQSALDILMVKELQNVDISDKDENRGLKSFKRTHSSTDEQSNESEIVAPEDKPLKYLKYDNSVENRNGNDNGSRNSIRVARKYGHNPNSLVSELRKLISTTEIGRQISIAMKNLREHDGSPYAKHYLEHDEQQDKVIQALNELKETNVGQKIFCILHKLEKAGIIEPINYLTNGEEEEEEEHGGDDDDDDDDEETVIAGDGLHIRPYEHLMRV